MASTRLHRCFQLLRLVLNNHQISTEDLAFQLDCSRRTIFRDLQLLKECGIEIHFDASAGGYGVRSPTGLWLPPGDDQALGLVLLAALSSPLAAHGRFRSSLLNTVGRAAKFLSEPAQRSLAILQQAVDQDSSGHDAGADGLELLPTLTHWIQQQCLLKFTICGIGSLGTTEVVVRAVGLLRRGKQWLVIAEPLETPAKIRIALERIQTVHVLHDSGEEQASSDGLAKPTPRPEATTVWQRFDGPHPGNGVSPVSKLNAPGQCPH